MTTTQKPRANSSISETIADVMLDQVRERMKACKYREIRNASVELFEDELIISGHVSSFYFKQVAQTLVRDLHGIKKIANNLTVD